MRLELDPQIAAGYRSQTQRARVISQSWVAGNLYCAACESRELKPLPEGNPVADFACPSCAEEYQLKSRRRPFGHRVVDGAYGPMMQRLRAGNLPSFIFVHYIPKVWRVWDVFIVPKYFFSESTIERRRELSAHARRAGWVGCDISLDYLPRDAKIFVIYGGLPLPERVVRDWWRRFSFLQSRPERGWTADVLACVRDLRKEVFALDDMYRLEERLGRLHPQNRNVRPKIRQQLQVLRDHGIIEFLGHGLYRVL